MVRVRSGVPGEPAPLAGEPAPLALIISGPASIARTVCSVPAGVVCGCCETDPDFRPEPGTVYLSGRITGRGPCRPDAPIAQTVERLHGKEKVNGSIPFGGSVRSRSVDVSVSWRRSTDLRIPWRGSSGG
jgi:hypothetical protein